MSVRLFVGNLPYQATEDDVRNHFAQAAPPVRVAIPVDRETGRPRGFAFIEFADAAQAEQAIRQFDGQPFMGRNLAVNEARAREDRGPSSPRPPMAPRPAGGGAPRGPSGDGGASAPGRGFGTPGRRARGGAGKREREERRPTGPIPVKVTGRVYNVDGVDEVEDESIEEFDDFATSLPKDDEATSSPNDDEADEEE